MFWSNRILGLNYYCYLLSLVSGSSVSTTVPTIEWMYWGLMAFLLISVICLTVFLIRQNDKNYNKYNIPQAEG